MARNQKIQVEVEGLNKVIRNMRKLGVTSEEFKDTMNKVGTVAVNTVRAEAPVRSGNTRDSIRASKRQTSVYIKGGNNRSRRSAKTAFYARFPEFGTSLQPAQGFIRRAGIVHADRFRKLLTIELAKKIRKAGF